MSLRENYIEMNKSCVIKTVLLLVGLMRITVVSSAQSTENDSLTRNNIQLDDILLNVFESGDVKQLDLILAPEFINHSGSDKIGIDSTKMMVRKFHSVIPGVRVNLLRRFTNGDYIVDWVQFAGADSTLIDGMEVTRYANGKAMEHWFFPNNQQNPPAANTYQAKAPITQPFRKEAFDRSDSTVIRWLGMGGFLINSRGTTLMVDPVLKGFDMPVMIDFPIKTEEVPRLDAVLVTHSDNDHYSIPTNQDLKAVTKTFHSTKYVDSLMKVAGLPSFGHDPKEKFKIGSLTVTMVAVDHAWQNAYPGTASRVFKNEDCTGFLIETKDGTIWAQGDSRLMPEHLTMTPPDAILFDFSDSEWHFTFEGAVKIANAYPNTPLLLSHWGSVDAPDFAPFNANPERLKKAIVNPDRIHVLAPGEPYVLSKLSRQ